MEKIKRVIAYIYKGIKKISLYLYRYIFKKICKLIIEFLLIIIAFFSSLIARFIRKKIDVGFGPEPAINNYYNKIAMNKYGYRTESYVLFSFFSTKELFDLAMEDKINTKIPRNVILGFIFLFFRNLFRYKCLYFYFNGGPLGVLKTFYSNYPYVLWKFEPFFYRIAKIKLVLMAYGGDSFEASKCSNLLQKHVMTIDYPYFKFYHDSIVHRIKMWTKYANFIIAGCDWVYYLFHWDMLISHFCIDLDKWKPTNKKDSKTFKVLHIPNHKNVKGSEYFFQAIDELKAEGFDLELIFLQGRHNSEINRIMQDVDIVADQLVIGWYGVTAMEGMAMGKPVLCYLRQELIDLYNYANVFDINELPIVNCDHFNVKEKLRELITNNELRKSIGQKSREFMEKYHSYDRVGFLFKQINEKLGI